MNIEKAINRLQFRFSSGNQFKPNNYDLEGVNYIIDWVNNQRSETFNNNVLFAKLFMYVFADLTRKYESNFLDTFIQKELYKLLDTDLKIYYSRITDLVNDITKFEYFKSKGVNLVHPMIKTNDDKIRELEILKNMSKEDLKPLIDNEFTQDDVINILNSMITECLNRYTSEAII